MRDRSQDTLLEQAGCSRAAADNCFGGSLAEDCCSLIGSCSEDILAEDYCSLPVCSYSVVGRVVLSLPCLSKLCSAEDILEGSPADRQARLQGRYY